MEKKSLAFTIVASVLIASGLSAFFSPHLASHLQFMFSLQVPGVNPSLIVSKSQDLAEFAVTLILSVIFCTINILLNKRSEQNSKLSDIFLLTSGLVIFLLTRFATYSGKSVLVIVALVEILFAASLFLSSRQTKTSNSEGQDIVLSTFSGGFLGFFTLLVLNKLTPVVIYPLMALITLPLINLWLSHFSKKWTNFMAHFPGILVPFLLLFPTNSLALGAWLIFTLVVWFVSFKFAKTFFNKNLLGSYVYPLILIILIGFNPLFYAGNFDSVEEGFWSGWVQRLIEHQTLYKDVMVYHPPLVIWSLYLFEKVSGFSLYSQRLFMHLLQLVGYGLYFVFLKKFIKKPWIIAVMMLCFFGLTSTAVKNNVEIRVGLGLASMVALTSENMWAAGGLAAISAFTSIEVGLATLGASLVYLVIARKNFLKWGLALLAVSSPIVLGLALQGSLMDFVHQITFYASAFSQGYFNSPIDRAISLSYFHWHIFNQYLGSGAMWFEISKLVVFAALIYGFIYDKKMFAVAIFALILSRVALGRSDYFHLLFPLLVTFGIIGYALDHLAHSKIVLATVLTSAVLLLGVRDAVSSQFLENLVFRLQTYGTVVGDYKKYNLDRTGNILVGTEINTKDLEGLVAYIQANTTENDTIFTYPWSPEIYFLANRKNATSVDTPYAFYTVADQAQMIAQLKSSKPKIIVFNNDMNFGGLSVGALQDLVPYLKSHYKVVKEFGKNSIME